MKRILAIAGGHATISEKKLTNQEPEKLMFFHLNPLILFLASVLSKYSDIELERYIPCTKMYITYHL